MILNKKQMNKILFLLIFIARINIIHAQPGLVACYPLDNNTNDFSGNNYHGTSYNLTPTTDRFGTPNMAYHFSGSGSSIEIPFNGFLLNDYTYSAWCRMTTLLPDPGLYNIISIGGTTLDQQAGITRNSSVGAYGFAGGSWGINYQAYNCWQGSLPSINQWYHFVYTRDNNMLNVYVDGILVCSTQSGNVNAGYASVLTGRIGSRITSTFQNFIGDIDDVRIFNRVLTLSEIQNMESSCKSKTGIASIDNQSSLNVYPNPVDDLLNISLNNNIKNGTLEIYNVLGIKVISEKLEGNFKSLNPHLCQGIYFIKVSDGNATWTKIIKKQ